MSKNSEYCLVAAHVPESDVVIRASAQDEVAGRVELCMRHKPLVSDEASNHLAFFEVIHVDQRIIRAGEKPRLRTTDTLIGLKQIITLETRCVFRKSGLIAAIEVVLERHIGLALALFFRQLVIVREFVDVHAAVDVRGRQQ